VVAVRRSAVPVRGRTGGSVRRTGPVRIWTRIPQLSRPVIRPVALIWPSHSRMRVGLPFLPAELLVRRYNLLPVVNAGVRLYALSGARAWLVGIAVSGRERVRPHWPELAQPILGRGFAEVGLRPLVSGPPAEYHLCRHPATKNHPPPSTTCVPLHDRTRAQALPAASDWPGPSFIGSVLAARTGREDHHGPCLTGTRGCSHGWALRPTIACTPTRRNPSAGAMPTGRKHRPFPSGHSGRK
jgi:hypothetical protein